MLFLVFDYLLPFHGSEADRIGQVFHKCPKRDFEQQSGVYYISSGRYYEHYGEQVDEQAAVI